MQNETQSIESNLTKDKKLLQDAMNKHLKSLVSTYYAKFCNPLQRNSFTETKTNQASSIKPVSWFKIVETKEWQGNKV